MDEKRLQNFNAYVLKKEAHELGRIEYASREKVRREKTMAAYDKVRSEFRRPLVVVPQGAAQHLRKIEQLEQSYEQIRKTFADKQLLLLNEFYEKIDRTKMIEYDL